MPVYGALKRQLADKDTGYHLAVVTTRTGVKMFHQQYVDFIAVLWIHQIH